MRESGWAQNDYKPPVEPKEKMWYQTVWAKLLIGFLAIMIIRLIAGAIGGYMGREKAKDIYENYQPQTTKHNDLR